VPIGAIAVNPSLGESAKAGSFAVQNQLSFSAITED
jgi:hypothetical protein